MKKRPSDLIRSADRGVVLVTAFNAFNYITVKALFEAFNELETPFILQFSQPMVKEYGEGYIVNMVDSISVEYELPFVLHLDHATDLLLIKRCASAGFTSVMYDGTGLLLEENIKNTKKVIDYCNNRGIEVEGEVGIIGGAEDVDKEQSPKVPTVDEVCKYIESTGVDLLAVAIGNKHGFYEDSNPQLDYHLLEEVSSKINVPLVFHGGSGMLRENIVKLKNIGVQKVNISTALKKIYSESLLICMEKYGYNYLKIHRGCIEETKDKIIDYYNDYLNG